MVSVAEQPAAHLTPLPTEQAATIMFKNHLALGGVSLVFPTHDHPERQRKVGILNAMMVG